MIAKLRFIDLFAGIGGIRIAFENIGAECVFSSEWDKHAQKTYEANFGERPHGDIREISLDVIPDFDILCAGFPCQPFSAIGKREGFKHKTQGTLFYEITRILQGKRPIAFLLENVVGLLTHDNGSTLKTILEALRLEGYAVTYGVLDAQDFGLPQRRKRVYLVGFLEGGGGRDARFKFPTPPCKTADIGEYIEHHAIGYGISPHLQKSYLFKRNDGKPEIVDRNSKGTVKTLLASYYKIQRLTGTFIKDGDTGIRLLSENECKALMGFDTAFKVPVSRSQMYRQFGNSVAIPVVEAIARQIKKVLLS